MSDPSAETTAPGDPLDALRRDLDGLRATALPERAEVFERAHRVLIDELNALEEA